mmetsp:Transcript_24986/g.40543  ORF Transcript_24986/g.40543 Transcript_24986/m.40543 type:complete len:450 (-) Transcript_24986:1513-2862(-)
MGRFSRALDGAVPKAHLRSYSCQGTPRFVVNDRDSLWTDAFGGVSLREKVQRIEDENEELRAFVRYCKLEEIDKRNHGPLQGLSYATKDSFLTKDFPTGYGVQSIQDPSNVDSAIVSMLNRLGATQVGKATLTEFALYTPAPAKNPHDLKRTPGASSSGSAVSVARGHVDFSIATQTGGSIIRPSAYTGVIGFKPTFNLLPNFGLMPVCPSLDTVGLMSRTLPCMHQVFGELMGLDNSKAVEQDMNHRGIRIGRFARTGVYGENFYDGENSENEIAMRTFLDYHVQKRGGDVVDDIPFPPSFTPEVYSRIHHYESSHSLYDFWTNENIQFSPQLRQTLKDSYHACSSEQYLVARKQAERCKAEMDALFEKYEVDMFIAPSTTGIAPYIADIADSNFPSGDPYINRVLTMLGNPCLHIPYGTYDSMPLGFQFVGKRYEDWSLLQQVGHIL